MTTVNLLQYLVLRNEIKQQQFKIPRKIKKRKFNQAERLMKNLGQVYQSFQHRSDQKMLDRMERIEVDEDD